MNMTMLLAVDILKLCLFAFTVMAGLVVVYFTLILHKKKEELYFIKRGLILVTIEHIFLIIFLNIGANLLIVVRYLHYCQQIPFHYVLTVGFLLVNGFIDIIVIRICYYYIQLHRVTTASKQIKIYSLKSLTNNPNSKIDVSSAANANNNKSNITTTLNPSLKNVSDCNETKLAKIATSTTANSTSAHACTDIKDRNEITTASKKSGYDVDTTMSRYLNYIGSPVRLAIVFAIIWTIDTVGVIIAGIFARDAARLVSFAQMYIIIKAVICVIVIVLTATQKTFRFADNWFISKEFIITGKIWIILGIIAFTAIAISRIVYSHIIFDLIFSYCIISMAFVRSYISVKWVIKQNTKNTSTSTTASPRSRSRSRSGSRSKNVNISMGDQIYNVSGSTAETPTGSSVDLDYSFSTGPKLISISPQMTSMQSQRDPSQLQPQTQPQSQSQSRSPRQPNVQPTLAVSPRCTSRFPPKSATQQAQEESVVLGLGLELADLPSNSTANSKARSKSKSKSRLSISIRKKKHGKKKKKNKKEKTKNKQDTTNKDQNRQLAHFWDRSRINDENLIEHFRLLWDHCAHELAIENLLFWIETIQLLEALIEYKYIDIEIDSDIDIDKQPMHAHALSLIRPLQIRYSTKQLHINDTLLIANLKAKMEKIKQKQKTNHSLQVDDKKMAHEGESDDDVNIVKNSNVIAKVTQMSHLYEQDYSLFGDYYVELYKKYFQKGSAPFELNIPGTLSNELNKCYDRICDSGNANGNRNGNQAVTKEFFEIQIWKNIKETAVEIYSLLWSSFQRMNIDN